MGYGPGIQVFYCTIYSTDSELFISALREYQDSRRLRFIAKHTNLARKESKGKKESNRRRKKKTKKKMRARHGGGCLNPGHLPVQNHSEQIG